MKYPILLVHGLAIKNYKFIKSFGNIEKILKDNNFNVYTSNQDGFGSIENNANQLKEEINKILKDNNCEKVNIIAHSKGGLDIKYMIEELNMEAQKARVKVSMFGRDTEVEVDFIQLDKIGADV